MLHQKRQLWRGLVAILFVAIINFSFAAPALATRYWKVINERDSLVNVAINGNILKPGQDSGSIYYPNTHSFELVGIGKLEFLPALAIEINRGYSYDVEYLMATNRDGTQTGYILALASISPWPWNNSALDVHIGSKSIWFSDYGKPGNPYLAVGQPMRETQLSNLFD